MNNLLSYCGLLDARIRASDKDLSVIARFLMFEIFEMFSKKLHKLKKNEMNKPLHSTMLTYKKQALQVERFFGKHSILKLTYLKTGSDNLILTQYILFSFEFYYVKTLLLYCNY